MVCGSGPHLQSRPFTAVETMLSRSAEESVLAPPARPMTRRGQTAPPPAPADPAPWQAALGGAPLQPNELQVLLSLARRRTVHAGTAVLDRQRLATQLVLLLSGDVVLGTRDKSGVLHAERTVTAPAWLDASAAWLNQPYAVDGNALNECVVAELPIVELRGQLARNPGLADRFLVALAARVQELTLASRSLMRQDAPARLASWLLQRCAVPTQAEAAGMAAPNGALVLKLHERKRDVASQLAMTPETLSRLLRSFEERGLIAVRGYTLVVQDPDGLQRLAASN